MILSDNSNLLFDKLESKAYKLPWL